MMTPKSKAELMHAGVDRIFIIVVEPMRQHRIRHAAHTVRIRRTTVAKTLVKQQEKVCSLLHEH